MSNKKVSDRLWVEDGGSIYCEDLDNVKVEFTGKTIKVRRAVAFNIGAFVATYICETHNAHVNWKNKNKVAIHPDNSGSMTGFPDKSGFMVGIDMVAFIDELNGKK